MKKFIMSTQTQKHFAVAILQLTIELGTNHLYIYDKEEHVYI